MTETYHLHLVSDSTGETTQGVLRACMAQFEGVTATTHLWPMVRSARDLDIVLQAVRDNPGAVMFTLVSERTRSALQHECAALNVPCISVIDPVIDGLARYLHGEKIGLPGSEFRDVAASTLFAVQSFVRELDAQRINNPEAREVRDAAQTLLEKLTALKPALANLDLPKEIEQAAQSIVDSILETIDKIKERESSVTVKLALWTLAMGIVASLGQGAWIAGIASAGIWGKDTVELARKLVANKPNTGD